MQVSTRDDVITKIKANRPALKQYSVRSLALFGSAARNKMRKSSDIDFLVQFDNKTWANYISAKVVCWRKNCGAWRTKSRLKWEI